MLKTLLSKNTHNPNIHLQVHLWQAHSPAPHAPLPPTSLAPLAALLHHAPSLVSVQCRGVPGLAVGALVTSLVTVVLQHKTQLEVQEGKRVARRAKGLLEGQKGC